MSLTPSLPRRHNKIGCARRRLIWSDTSREDSTETRAVCRGAADMQKRRNTDHPADTTRRTTNCWSEPRAAGATDKNYDLPSARPRSAPVNQKPISDSEGRYTTRVALPLPGGRLRTVKYRPDAASSAASQAVQFSAHASRNGHPKRAKKIANHYSLLRAVSGD